MAKNIITNKLATIVAVKMAQKAGFLKIGSKDYFADQINSKMKAGTSYDFILPDAGNVVAGMTASPRDIEEKKVTLTIKNWVNSVNTGALEEITDLKWEEEIADQYAGKLMNKVLADAADEASVKYSTAFIGSGYGVLANAGAYVQSISDEDVFGFIDPMAQAVITSNGQSFQPCGAPESLYSKGHLGIFQGVDYTAFNKLKPIKISQNQIDGLASATVTGYNATTGNLTLGVTAIATGKAFTIPAGTPFFMDGVYACDLVGDATSNLFAWVAQEDVDVAVAATSIVIPVGYVETNDIGSREVDGTIVDATVTSFTEAGSYRKALIRADGAFCFSPVNTLEFKVSDETASGEVDGIKLLVNAFTNGLTAVNTTRWDFPSLYGTVEKRAVSMAFIKQA